MPRSPVPLPAAALAGLLLAACAVTAKDTRESVAASGPAAVPLQETESGESQQEPSGARPQEDEAPTASEPPERQASTPGPDVPIHGSLRARYRFWSTSHENDQDVEGTLTVDVGDPERHPLTGHLMLWSNLDLDEQAGASGPDPFFDLEDTYGSDLTARLYQAYVDAHGVEGVDVLRLGRQPLDETPEFVTFDGARLEMSDQGWLDLRAGAYGGVPVHFFESSPEGDLVLGTFVETRPWRGGRVRLDWMHLEDELLLADHQDDLLALGWWQGAGPVRLATTYSWLEGASRDLSATASWNDAPHDLQVQASYYQLLETQKDLATEVDPFFDALLEHFPFYRARLLFSKGFAERYRLEVGSEARQLVDEGDEGEFNHEYWRNHAHFAVEELLDQALTLSLTGEIWDADDASVNSWAADLTREWERWKASVGSYFALYDQDLFSLDERNDVRVYYLGLRHDLRESASLDLAYEFEDDDLDSYQVLRMGILWHF